MIRIRSADQDGARVIRLEGRLTAAELPLLEEAIDAARGSLVLDLAALRELDATAAARLSALRASGAALTAGSAFVERMLALQAR
jgi:anti-anti-sigma regulatory factor